VTANQLSEDNDESMSVLCTTGITSALWAKRPQIDLVSPSVEVRLLGSVASCGVTTMMSAAECAKRAAECQHAAQSSSGSDAEARWRLLSQSWTKWSKIVDRLTDPEQAPFPRITRREP